MCKPNLKRGVMLALLYAVAACGPQKPVSRAPDQAPPAAAPADAVEYRIVPGASEIRVLAYRDGPLASLGHNHVISTTAVDGTVALATPVNRSTVSLQFAVDSLQVDIPEQRAEEGEDFPGALDQSAIDGTRANMLGDRVLDAANFPLVSLRSRSVTGEMPMLRLLVDVVVRDQVTAVEIPVRVTQDGNQLTATGEVGLLQTELGLEPFSAALGALFVRDELELKFRLVAAAAGF